MRRTTGNDLSKNCALLIKHINIDMPFHNASSANLFALYLSIHDYLLPRLPGRCLHNMHFGCRLDIYSQRTWCWSWQLFVDSTR